MEEFVDVQTITQVAIFMVGITQLFKQFLEIKGRKLKIAITVAVGAIGGALLHFLPHWVFSTLLGISVGVVFYDYFLKLLEKLFKATEQ